MMAGYFAAGRHDTPATFELFVRRLPRNRQCLVAAGLEPALEYTEALRFTGDDIDWLRRQPPFAHVAAGFFEYLRAFRFSGDVHAMAEGTPFFANEPVLRVTAPLAQAQLLETALLAFVNFQTSIASKGVRLVLAAQGRPVMEFGARRAHGVEAAAYAARAAYIAGCDATSFVEAARRFDIPVSGTMAHSWVLAAESELAAFNEYSALFRQHSALLLDTYDVMAAAHLVVESGLRPPAVRIDSGDLAELALAVRGIFDAGGLSETRILISGDLDEWKIRDMVESRAPIDGFAVGTALTTSDDAPALGGVYKLVELGTGADTRRVMKRSTGKATWPGQKQVWRAGDHDVVSLAEEPGAPGAQPLLEEIMREGARVAAPPSLAASRERCRAMVAALPAPLRELEPSAPYEILRGQLLEAAMQNPNL